MRLSEMELDNLRHLLISEDERGHEVAVEVNPERAAVLEDVRHAAISRVVMNANGHVPARVQDLFPRTTTYANYAYVHPPIESDKVHRVKYAYHRWCQVFCKPLPVVKAPSVNSVARPLLGSMKSSTYNEKEKAHA